MPPNRPHSGLFRRARLLWMVWGAMLLVSVFPLGLYHRQVLRLSQEKLTDTESVQQTAMTRSVGEELQLFDTNLYQQLISERQILAVTGLLDKINDPVPAPQATPLLVDDQFPGMLAAVVSLDGILRRLQEASVRGRVLFVVNRSGQVIAHPDTRQFVPGADLRSTSHAVSQILALPAGLRATETVRRVPTSRGRHGP